MIISTSIGAVSQQKYLTDLKTHLTSIPDYEHVEHKPQIHSSKSSVSTFPSTQRSHQTMITCFDRTHYIAALPG